MYEPLPLTNADVTLAAYELAADRYLAAFATPAPALVGFLDHFATMIGRGTVLELGSGTGWDARHLERRGVVVTRSDAAQSFIDMLHGQGYPTARLDIRFDDLGGPHDGVLADAVLLHLSRAEFATALRRILLAVNPGGILAFTVKEGPGEGWSEAKLELPRHFTYWQSDQLRAELTSAGWELLSIEHVAGSVQPWLYVIARRPQS